MSKALGDEDGQCVIQFHHPMLLGLQERLDGMGGWGNHNRNEPNARHGNLIMGFHALLPYPRVHLCCGLDQYTPSVPLPLACASLVSHTEGALYSTPGQIGNRVPGSALPN